MEVIFGFIVILIIFGAFAFGCAIFEEWVLSRKHNRKFSWKKMLMR